MPDARARTLGSDGALSSAFNAMGVDTCDDELSPYFNDDDGDDWNFSDVPVDSHVDACSRFHRVFDARHDL